MVQSTAEPLSFGFAGAAHIRRVFTHQSGGPPLEAEKIPRQLPSGWGGLQAAPTPKPGTCSLLVYATMRNLAKKERLLECVRGCHASTLEILQLDVTDPLSLAAAAQQVPEQRVDVLVCNAGVGLMGPLETCSYQAMKTIFDVNVFGTIGTIQAFLPGMKRRKAGKIIISSSVGALQGIPFNAVYCASKFAVEGLCESLAVILQPFNVHITLIECGPVNTSFLANLQSTVTEGSVLQGLDPQTCALYSQYLQHCQSLFRDVAQDTEEVFLEAICTPCPPLRSFTTQFFMPLTRLKLTSPDGSEYVRAMHKFVFSAGEAQGDRA
ncbi:17-beta-hydroxysteroid dehydrogenase type 1 isoform X2 [Chelonia mydas]|uniref:17-beta-hydroxysteroid dehydrogenase type 1 isoform X2 n=1 Tax=Chelonia mydas TaxID=8469 RepID=UPI001CA7D803|nr:17-beta-hydroxysteroid dehydrogenase type 1 isoform X2 [Chelonia mydas]